MGTIWIVIGTTGHWADASTWNVCFKSTKEAAEEVKKLCQAQADDYLKWRRKKRPLKKSFWKRHTRFEEEEYAAEEKAKRDSMFDKWFSCDLDGTRYYIQSLSEDPSVDPKWIEHQAWWANYQAEQVAEQMKHCTLDDRSAFAKFGDLLKSKLTMK